MKELLEPMKKDIADWSYQSPVGHFNTTSKVNNDEQYMKPVCHGPHEVVNSRIKLSNNLSNVFPQNV
jgi:hypothetical protein